MVKRIRSKVEEKKVNKMKLEWQCTPKLMTWDEAVKYADSFKREGWRLPTIKELMKEVKNGGDQGYLEGNIFFDYYGDDMYLREVPVWSSTELKDDKGYAYSGDPVDIVIDIESKNEEFRVILCRKTS
jgi:hypothetical protein